MRLRPVFASSGMVRALLGGLVASGLGIGPSAASEPPPSENHAPTTHEATARASPGEIDPALTRTPHLIATSNIVANPQPPEAVKLHEMKMKLQAAQEARRGKNYTEAEALFVSVLESNPPPELNRTALLELALTAQEQHQLPRAQEIYTRYVLAFPQDPSIAEVLLRQGLIYREMGATGLAIGKFYDVLSSARSMDLERLDYFEKVVLHAKSEIADTYYLQGDYEQAVRDLRKLLKSDHAALHRQHVHFKLAQSLFALERHAEAVAEIQRYLELFPDGQDLAEARFLQASAYKKMGRNRESMESVIALLQAKSKPSGDNEDNWTYWRQRTGNEIGNLLYQEGDFINALEVYKTLATLNDAPTWKVPVLYQIGLVYERLEQAEKAAQTYDAILEAGAAKPEGEPSPALTAVYEMARWRKDHLAWQVKAEKMKERLRGATPGLPVREAPNPPPG